MCCTYALKQLKTIIVLVLLLAVVSANQIDTLLPENCGDPIISGFLSAEAKASCADIASMEESDETKKMLMLGLLYPSIGYIDTNFLHGWNTAWTYTEPPPGVSMTSDHEYNNVHVIQNAWVDIIAVTPVVRDKESNTLLAPTHGEVQTAFNATFETPPDKESDEEGCAYSTLYQIMDQGTEMTVSLNNNVIGQGPAQQQVLLPYSTEGGMDFNAKLDAWADLRIREYKPRCILECWEETRGNSTVTICVCNYVCEMQSETLEHLTVTTSSNYDHIEPYSYGFHFKQVMDTTNKAVIHVFSLAPLNEFYVRFGNAYYKKSEWDYGLEYDKEPYNVLKGTASKTVEKEEFNGMVIEREINNNAVGELQSFIITNGDSTGTGQALLTKSQTYDYPITHTTITTTIEPDLMDGSCEMAVSSHFERLTVKGFCDTDPLPETTLELTTNKDSYEDGENVVVTVELKSGGSQVSGPVNINFQGERKTITVNGPTTVSFKASGTGAITAEYTTDLTHSSAQSTNDVVVHHEWAWQEAENLVILAIACFFVYVLMKATVGKVKV